MMDEATVELDELLANPEIRELHKLIGDLKASLDKWIIKTAEPGDGLATDDWTGTKVQGHRRTWNPDKLMKLIPYATFRKVVDIKVNGQKVDELVRAGKIKVDIEEAYEEVPNAAYVKWTPKSGNKDAGDKEAQMLRGLLG